MQIEKDGQLMIGHNIVDVIIAPPDKPQASLILEAASILNKDPYETRLLLTGEIPKIVAHYESTQEAELIAKRLKGLGLVAIVCNDEKLRVPSSSSFTAHTLNLGDKEVTFWDKTGQTRKLVSKDVFLILKGRIRAYTGKGVTKTRMKFNLPATLLIGGFPVWSKVKEETKDASVEEQHFVSLYGQMSPEPIIEILESYFDFSPLGSKIAPSSSTNLNTLTVELRNAFPKALFDDRLSSRTQGIEIELNSKLIYLYYQAVSNPNLST
jgi:hypothetical protein